MSQAPVNPVLQKLRQPQPPEHLCRLLLTRALPVTERELLESVCFLVALPAWRAQAVQTLDQIGTEQKNRYLSRPPHDPQTLYVLSLDGLRRDDDELLLGLLTLEALPLQAREKIAARGSAEVLDALLAATQILLDHPELLDAIQQNPNASGFHQAQIQRIRDVYQEQPSEAEPATTAEAPPLPDEPQAPVAPLQTPPEQAAEEPAADQTTPGEADAQETEGEEEEGEALNLNQKLMEMNVAEKIRLATTGSRSERTLLLKDPNKMVQEAIVASPKLTEDEAVSIIRNRSVPGEMIGKLAKRKELTRNYLVALELMLNPKTPVSDALNFLSRIQQRDLLQISKDRNVSPVIRNRALQAYKARTNTK